MKILFDSYKQKKKIKAEPSHFPVLSTNLAEYRTGRKGYIDMNAAASIVMPLAQEIAIAHEQGQALPGLRPDTVDIKDRRLTLNDKVFSYEGVIFPGFSAPEIYTGSLIQNASDIYTFTALIYYIIIGKAPENAYNRLATPETPLVSDSFLEEIKESESIYVPELQIEYDPFESEAVKPETTVFQTNSILDIGFIAILERGLSLDAANRFSSMRELIAELTPFSTKADCIYPILFKVDEDKIHSNLITKKTIEVKSKTKGRVITPKVKTVGNDIVLDNVTSDSIDALDETYDHNDDIKELSVIEDSSILVDETSFIKAETALATETVLQEEIATNALHTLKAKFVEFTQLDDEENEIVPDLEVVDLSSEQGVEIDELEDYESQSVEIVDDAIGSIDTDALESTEETLDEMQQIESDVAEVVQYEMQLPVLDELQEILRQETPHIVHFGVEDVIVVEESDKEELLKEEPPVSNEVMKSIHDIWEMLESL